MNKIAIGVTVVTKVKNWPDYFKDYLGMKRGEVVYYLRDGTTYLVRGGSNDRNVFNDVVVRSVYTPPGFEIGKGEVVVDIGAHIGFFSVLAAKTAGKVYSFEPEPRNFSLLVKNATMNGRNNIIPINKAMAGTTGSAQLFIDAYNKGNHSFYKSFMGNKESNVTVETVSLQDFFYQQNLQYIDFLKVDCEGGEYDILFNCPAQVLEKIGKISMECHDLDKNYTMNAMKDFLERQHFDVICKQSSPPLGMLYATRKRKLL